MAASSATRWGAALRAAVLPAVLWAALPAAQAAEINVRVDGDDIRVGETFTVTFESSIYITDPPDFSPLHKDFDVVGTKRSQVFRLVLGKESRENKWIVTLLPKRAGLLVIPPVHFGHEATRARVVEVREQNQPAAAGGRQEIFLEVEAQPMNPYVQAQVFYTVRLYRRAGMKMQSATLGEPQAASGGDLRVKQLGKRNYQASRHELPYRVDELRYALIPQSSGRLELAPIGFRAQVPRQGSARPGLDPFGLRSLGVDTKVIVRRSPPLVLDVRPVPAAFPADRPWLPSRRLELSASWAEQPPVFRVGTPVTRVVALRGTGLFPDQLMLPDWPLPAEFRSYADQPSLQDQSNAQGLQGSREQRFALIPGKPGEYELPALALPWWNTESDRLEYARLPAERIRVLAAAAAGVPAAPPAAAAAPGDSMAPPDLAAAPAAAPPAAAPPRQEAARLPVLWWLCTGALALGWVLTLALWWWRGRRRPAVPSRSADSARVARARLRAACRAGRAAEARQALLDWGRQLWPEVLPMRLEEIGRRCPEMRQQLEALNRSLYRQEEGWSGPALWEAFRYCSAAVPPAAAASGAAKRRGLAPLYP